MAGRVVEALSGLGDPEQGITWSLHGTASLAEFSNILHTLSTVAPKLGVRVCVLYLCSTTGCSKNSRPQLLRSWEGGLYSQAYTACSRQM